MLTRAFILIAAAGLAAAQIPSISANCSAAFLAIINDPGASACLSPLGLISLLTGGSTISAIDQWLDKICAAAPCSNATIATVVNTLIRGCPSELATYGVTSSASVLVTIVQLYYPTVRQIACLKEGNTNCLTETLNNFQTATGQSITPPSFINSALCVTNGLPSNVTCTACLQASYDILAQQQPGLASAVRSTLQSQCGAYFTDGSQPTDIVESASSSTGTSSSSTASAATSSNPTAGPAKSSNSAARVNPMDLSSSMSILVGLGLSSLFAFGSAVLFV